MNREPSSLPVSAAKTAAGDQPAAFLVADERLETAIECTQEALKGAHTPVMRAELKEQIRKLIGQRSMWALGEVSAPVHSHSNDAERAAGTSPAGRPQVKNPGLGAQTGRGYLENHRGQHPTSGLAQTKVPSIDSQVKQW